MKHHGSGSGSALDADPNLSGSVFSLKCWIQIRIKWIRIRNTTSIYCRQERFSRLLEHRRGGGWGWRRLPRGGRRGRRGSQLSHPGCPWRAHEAPVGLHDSQGGGEPGPYRPAGQSAGATGRPVGQSAVATGRPVGQWEAGTARHSAEGEGRDLTKNIS